MAKTPSKPPARPAPKPAAKPAPRQTSPKMSTLGAKVMNGYKPTRAEQVSMAASLVSQDQTKGQNSRTK